MKKLIPASMIFMSLFSVPLKIAAAAQSKAALPTIIEHTIAARHADVSESRAILTAINESIAERNKQLKKLISDHDITATETRQPKDLDTLVETIIAPIQKMLKDLKRDEISYSYIAKQKAIIEQTLDNGKKACLPPYQEQKITKLTDKATKTLTSKEKSAEEYNAIAEKIIAPLQKILLQTGIDTTIASKDTTIASKNIDTTISDHQSKIHQLRIKIATRKEVNNAIEQALTAGLPIDALKTVRMWAERTVNAINKPK